VVLDLLLAALAVKLAAGEPPARVGFWLAGKSIYLLVSQP
jgi:hypothetical protein